MVTKREWIEWYIWDKIRVRVRMEKDGAEIIDFTIQLEVNDAGWNPVVRYNYAHGTPHRDLIHKNRKKEKLWMHGKMLNEVFNYAKEDIIKNWRKYLKECGYDEIEEE